MIEEGWLFESLVPAMARLRENQLAIDVGAKMGEWSIELENIFGRVVAYEPDPRGAILIPQGKIEVRQCAVSNRKGVETLYKRPDNGHNSLYEEHPIEITAPIISTVPVDTVTLDEEFPLGADFVKIDTEGAEVDILSACTGERWRRTLFLVELHGTTHAVANHLWRLGKSVKLIKDRWLVGEDR